MYVKNSQPVFSISRMTLNKCENKTIVIKARQSRKLKWQTNEDANIFSKVMSNVVN